MTTQADAWLCQQIVDHISDAIIFADREGVIRLWNKAAEAMFGYGADEAIGQSLDIIIPEGLRKKHWEGYHKVVETGESRYSDDLLSVPGLKKDGSRISLEFSIALLNDEAGERLGFAAIIRDVTKRWEEQKALKARLAELEGKTEKP